MGLDLWFREDVARILASAQETIWASTQATSPASPETASAYQQGFLDALRVIGIAFGVASPTPPIRPGERMTLLEGGPSSRARGRPSTGPDSAGTFRSLPESR